MPSIRRWFGPRLVAISMLASCAVALALTAIPGIFSIDEAHHIAAVFPLQRGQLGMPGTESLPPSPELLYFDPSPRSRASVRLPVVATVPPLYGMVALPFSWLGVRGLQWLNVLATTWAGWLVWLYARRYATHRSTPWIALALMLCGSYVLEYAAGIWAHGLSLGLAVTAYWHAARARETGQLEPALLGGLVAGLAAGVRYQNAVLALLIGATVVLLGRNRLRQGLCYGVGAAFPVGLSAWLNHLRQGSWNPISKGPGFLSPPGSSPGADAQEVAGDALSATWTRIVDAATHPPFPPGHDFAVAMPHDPGSGAFLVLDVVRKALLQSVPWFALVFVAIVVAWLPARWRRDAAEHGRAREMRSAALLIIGMISMFATFGYQRPEGWAFNQRYLIELLPLGALCAAWTLERMGLRWPSVAAGVGTGTVLAALTLWAPGTVETSRRLVLLLPILLAGMLGVAAVGTALVQWSPLASPWLRRVVSVLTAAGFGWALLMHVAEDVRVSREVRAKNQTRAAIIRAALPVGPVAVFGYWGTKDPLAVLHFEHDVVGADARIDDGRSARMLSEAMLAQGRTILVLVWGMPAPLLEELAFGRDARVLRGRLTLLEVRAR